MRVLFSAICLFSIVISANSAFAQAGQVCLFADSQGLNCSIVDVQPGLLSIYVVHTQAANVMGIEFSAPKPGCMTGATWLADSFRFPAATIGTSQTGVAVGYGSCLSSPIHVLTILYFAQGSTMADCPYEILPHPISGGIAAVDCDFVMHEAGGSTTFINSNLPCTCNTSSAPLLTVNPTSLDFGYTSYFKSFTIGNVGGGTLTWTVSESVPWLTVSRTSGSGSATILVTVDRTGLPTGLHTGLIDISSNGGNETVTVTMGVAEPDLEVSPTFFNFPATSSAGVMEIWNAGGGSLDWSIAADEPWLSATPSSGSGIGEVTVHIDRTGLPDGTYNGNLLVTSNGGDATIPVEMIVNTQPILDVHPNLLVFNPSVTTGAISIANAGQGTLNWSIATDRPWIQAAPLSGTGSGSVTVTVDAASLPCCDMLLGHVQVSSNGGSEVVEIKAYPTSPPTGGSVGIYADAAGTACDLSDATVGLTTYYVVHQTSAGVTACAYWAPKPSCFTATWLSDTNAFPVAIGNSQAGVSIAYGACRSGAIHVQSISFMTNGNTPDCCIYPILGIPTSGKVEATDCDLAPVTANGVTGVINSNSSCVCGSVRVEETTWGRVKSLYADD